MPTLIIMRHGEAEPVATTDAQRRLTANGQLASKTAANELYKGYLNESESLHIFHSPYLRTTQTTELVAEKMALMGQVNILIEAKDILLETHTPSQVAQWLNSLKLASADTVMLVSHQPLVSLLTTWLVGGESSSSSVGNHPMMPASVAVLKLDFAERGCATLVSLQHYA